MVTGKARSHIRHFLKSMQSEESAHLGERMLNQALRALHADLAGIEDARWQKLMRDYGVKSRQEVLTDIGLGKRLNVMVAHQLLALAETAGERSHGQTARQHYHSWHRGHGGAVCQVLPTHSRRPDLGFINKDKGLVIHTHDCPSIRKFRLDPDKWLDVEWDPETKRLFKVNLKLAVANQPGMLAKIAAGIADAGSNIDNVSMEETRRQRLHQYEFHRSGEKTVYISPC